MGESVATFDPLYIPLTFAAAIGSALIAGAFFAFSTFVMKALGRLPAAEGMAAMQSINVAVINPWFLGVFLGTALVCVAALGGAWVHWGKPGAVYVLAGCLLYLVGTFLVTGVFNVPLNNALAALTSADADSARQWAGYVSRWTAWNHVRTIAALAATGSFILALRR